MGNIKVIKGNLIELAKQGKYDAICHGANCWNKMGAGIAKEIKKNFPEAWKADQDTIPGDKTKLGSFTWNIKKYKDYYVMIFNLYTQYYYDATKKPLDYNALKESLRRMGNKLKEIELLETKIGMPLIGAGLGGGKLELIIPIIYNELSEFDVDIVVFDKMYNINETIKEINELLKKLKKYEKKY